MVTATRPLISFLMTAYRTEQYVAEAIQSVLDQTRTDWELVVVDNGNSDEMARIVEGFADDPRITLKRQPNRGIRGGVTAAADLASGRYVCAFNSDDVLRADFCERVGALIEADPAIDAVSSDADLFRHPYDGVPPKGWFGSIGWKSVPDPSRTVSLDEMLDDGVPLYLGVFRREIWDFHRAYDPAGDGIEPDIELWLGMAATGCDIRILHDRLARIRLRSDSESRDEARIERFEHDFHEAFLAVSRRYPVSESRVLNCGMVRRLRYTQALRRARWALLSGDIPAARSAARAAFHHQHTLRAAGVLLALHLTPRLLRSVHPVKNSAQNAWSRARFQLAGGRAL